LPALLIPKNFFDLKLASELGWLGSGTADSIEQALSMLNTLSMLQSVLLPGLIVSDGAIGICLSSDMWEFSYFRWIFCIIERKRGLPSLQKESLRTNASREGDFCFQ
jgi:hypothetical protein